MSLLAQVFDLKHLFKVKHPLHLVNPSPWPLIGSLVAVNIVVGLLKWFNLSSFVLLLSSMMVLGLIMTMWWGDVSAEATYQGLHSKIVEMSMVWGMILFIVSEIFFFLSFFWAFFHSSLSPDIAMGFKWPPLGVNNLAFDSVPLLNTVVLVSSGVTLTWAHESLKVKNLALFKKNTLITIALGLYFTALQLMEYLETSFSFSDSVFGSSFFIATGFHGLHVIIGTVFIMVTLFRSLKGQLSPSHHFGFEASAWYWHFVDLVWLGLFMMIYWWGGL